MVWSRPVTYKMWPIQWYRENCDRGFFFLMKIPLKVKLVYFCWTLFHLSHFYVNSVEKLLLLKKNGGVPFGSNILYRQRKCTSIYGSICLHMSLHTWDFYLLQNNVMFPCTRVFCTKVPYWWNHCAFVNGTSFVYSLLYMRRSVSKSCQMSYYKRNFTFAEVCVCFDRKMFLNMDL